MAHDTSTDANGVLLLTRNCTTGELGEFRVPETDLRNEIPDEVLAKCRAMWDVPETVAPVLLALATSRRYQDNEAIGVPTAEGVHWIEVRERGQNVELANKAKAVSAFMGVVPRLHDRQEAIRRDDALLKEKLREEQAEQRQLLEIEREESRWNAFSLLDDVAVEAHANWVLPGLLRRGEVLAFTGSNGAGKSTAIYQLCHSMAVGSHPVSQAMIPKQRVLYIALQNSTLAVKQMRDRMPVALSPDDRLHVETANSFRCYLDEPEDAERLAALIRDLQPDVVAIGPVGRMSRHQTDLGAKATEFAKMFFAFFRDLMAEMDEPFALIVEMHEGKSAKDRSPRGSKLWSDEPDYGVWVSKTLRSVTWREPRDAERPWPEMRRVESTHGWPWDMAVTDARSSDVDEAVVRAYVASNPEASQVAVAKATAVPRSTVQRILKRLGEDS
jgi:hypothetical protein